VIQQVIGEGRGGTTRGTAGDVASAIVAAAVDLPCFVRTGGTGTVETGELVWLAVTVEVLLLAASAPQGALPQLAQVRVDIAVGVAGSAQTNVVEIIRVSRPHSLFHHSIRNCLDICPRY